MTTSLYYWIPSVIRWSMLQSLFKVMAEVEERKEEQQEQALVVAEVGKQS
ncbi:hypothetical protein RchiOBHm_Chr2g0098101 [Rosa chinensis]|uniref:Uncharacterized protein n=1 Tax=Rosa chinensis TaxID=74649 RepID=A0A2P6RLM1_ROSCH|nr:hypothetical protein RchiOBHm_Chr2g0098101 [Rosa chinensis]